MTSILQEDDKIFTMYSQYKDLLDKIHTLEKNGKSQIAAHLTVAHMLDHVACLIKEDKPPTAKKIKKVPQTLLETFSKTNTSASSEVDIDWKRGECEDG